MSASPEYRSLLRRVVELKDHLLPVVFDPTGSYSDDVFDRTRGFIALTHAEIEAYIEDRCLALARQSVRSWHSSKTPSAITFTLYAMCYSDWVALESPPILKKATHEVRIEARIDNALEQYEQLVGDNHGIKDANLKKLLVPLSVRMKTDLDPAWLSSMSSFGRKRGQVVHTSARVSQPPDPQATLTTVKKVILPGLAKLDRLLNQLGTRLIANPPVPKRTIMERLKSAWYSFNR